VAYPTNSVLEIDSDVLSLAESKDQERMACLPSCNLSKLHGIPIGIKDNICSDGLNCTAG
jgi:Asp-tRNA(Asn)/Glu-tRNA(Gln) amidotransferase A subunit family amidase